MGTEPPTDPASVLSSREAARARRSLATTLSARGLVQAGLYQRAVPTSLERVWENVFDWEHLPWLHAASFESIELLERGAWGWRARVGLARGDRARRGAGARPAAEIVLEVRVERAAGRYVSATLEGPGAGIEIWTWLRALAPHLTRVDVGFWVPDSDPERVRGQGAVLERIYARLWDEDESMMVRRSAELAAGRDPSRRGTTPEPAGPVILGSVDDVRRRVPYCVELFGRRIRLVEVGGTLWAHSTRCPHMLGPLEAAPIEEGAVRCPWHGYRFDVASGESVDGRRLCLERAPRIRVERGQVIAEPV